MARLVWDAVGERTFETGVDRGVLFPPDDLDGVAWNGLISVNENPSGGEVEPYYVDGVKYLNVATVEEFEATLEAFSVPREFALAEGIKPAFNGLFVTQQRKKPFGLAYRTLIGDDLLDENRGYKIHLVYNATVAPPEKTYNTISAEVEPTTLSWEIVTRPMFFEAASRLVSHVIIDSTQADPAALTALENAIYGTTTTESYLPSFEELYSIFE